MVRAKKHTNNKGLNQVKRGKTRRQVEHMARRLGLKYGTVIVEPPNNAQERKDKTL